MTSGANLSQRSLPRLSGRLLCCYRIAWAVLAFGAVLTSVLSASLGAADPLITLVGVAKSAVLLSVATILFYRRQHDAVAALLALAFLTWTISSSHDLATGAELAQLLDRCRFLLFALGVLFFPDGRVQRGRTEPIVLATASAFLVGIAETLRLLPSNLFLPLAIICVLAAVGSLIARFRTSTNYALRQQVKWVALGLIAGVCLILGARAGSAVSGSTSGSMPLLWEVLFQLGIIIVALGFLVSLLRFRLFDAEAVISRSAAYAALTIALVATFGGTEAAIENLGQLYLGMNIGSISGAMAAAVAAVLLNPLHSRITEWAENRFQPDLAQLKRDVPDLLARLGKGSSSRHLCNAVLLQITNALHAKRSAMVLDGVVVASEGMSISIAQHWNLQPLLEHPASSSCERTDLLFPVRLALGGAGSDAPGWILLGPRPDGTLYRREDLDAVRSVVPALQQGLVVTRHREALDISINRREKRFRTEIRRIHARLSALERQPVERRSRAPSPAAPGAMPQGRTIGKAP